MCGIGEKGIIQVVSAIPESYPGHSLLTEDEGVILGEDDCACGRKGKYFSICERFKNAEIRGCSIPMERIFEHLKFEIGDERILKKMLTLPAGIPFEEGRIDFLNQISGEPVVRQKGQGVPGRGNLCFLDS